MLEEAKETIGTGAKTAANTLFTFFKDILQKTRQSHLIFVNNAKQKNSSEPVNVVIQTKHKTLN